LFWSFFSSKKGAFPFKNDWRGNYSLKKETIFEFSFFFYKEMVSFFTNPTKQAKKVYKKWSTF
jgi:hypothetical protein